MNIERKTEIRLIDGIPQMITIEIDKKENEIIDKHLANIRKMKETGFNTSGRSTNGKAKKSGNMARSMQARNFKNAKTNTAIRKSNIDKVNKYGVDQYYSLDLPQA